MIGRRQRARLVDRSRVPVSGKRYQCVGCDVWRPLARLCRFAVSTCHAVLACDDTAGCQAFAQGVAFWCRMRGSA